MVVREFIERYVREQDFYGRVAELCGRRLEQILRESNIRAITSWRAKRPDRLKTKLEERDEQRRRVSGQGYTSAEEIYDDIPDLAGARVALYFPSDRARLRELILRRFQNIRPPKSFPIPHEDLPEQAQRRRQLKRFSGYAAEHFRVKLVEAELGPDERRFSSGVCEVQVASVLMHAWAEVEHDLEYKNLSGEVSETESVLLDQINGLVVAGEIALEQLRRVTHDRTAGGFGGIRAGSVRDQFDLASWLSLLVQNADGDSPRVGRADLAYRFIELLGLTSFASLLSLQQRIRERLDDSTELTLAEALVEALLDEDAKRETALQRARNDVAAAEKGTAPVPSVDVAVDEVALGRFLARWRLLEHAASVLKDAVSPFRGPPNVAEVLSHTTTLQPERLVRVREIQRLRARAVHATSDAPSPADMFAAVSELDDLFKIVPEAAKDSALRQRLSQILRIPGPPEEATLKRGELEVDAGPLVLVTDRRVAILPLSIVNRATTSNTAHVTLVLGGLRIVPSLPLDGLVITGLAYLDVERGLRLEPMDWQRGALYFSLPAESAIGATQATVEIETVGTGRMIVVVGVQRISSSS